MNELLNDVERIILSEEQIISICKKLGDQISKDYLGKNPLFVGFLKGCAPFFCELIKRVTVACEIDFIIASSYSGSSSTGTVKIKKDLDQNIEGRDIILVEDIVETGTTLSEVIKLLNDRNPNSIKVVTLLDKPCNRNISFKPDYCGKEIPNEFVIGFGLDYNEKYRNLPFIGVLKKEIYSK